MLDHLQGILMPIIQNQAANVVQQNLLLKPKRVELPKPAGVSRRPGKPPVKADGLHCHLRTKSHVGKIASIHSLRILQFCLLD